MALYMAKVARPRYRPYLMIAILAPLWAAYLVKAYAWRVMLQQGGLLDEVLRPSGSAAPATASPRPCSSWPTCGCRT